jgi:uncharacterized membrane protein YkvA (DUF1232 family)
VSADERVAQERARARAAEAPRSRSFRRASTRAQDYVRHPDRLADLLKDATRKAEQPPSGRMGATLEDLKALVRLASAYVRGDYRAVSRDNLVKVIAAIVYFVSPIDLLPDFLGPFGLTDDAVVVAFVLRKLREELSTFLAWEEQQERASSTPPALPEGDVS